LLRRCGFLRRLILPRGTRLTLAGCQRQHRSRARHEPSSPHRGTPFQTRPAPGTAYTAYSDTAGSAWRSGTAGPAGKRKAPGVAARGLPVLDQEAGLQRLDLIGLQALLALHDLERDLLAFLQRLEAGAHDRTEMDEHVLAVLRGDETEALGVVEPLDGTDLTIRHLATPWNKLTVGWMHRHRGAAPDCVGKG